jgi:putative sigma-54 modulation protein
MELLVRNAEGNLSVIDREYASKKLGKLDRFFQAASKVEMVHREEKHNHHAGHRVEITVYADGLYVRGEEYDVSLRAAIDKVADKMELRLKKFKGRLIDRHRRKGTAAPPTPKIRKSRARAPKPVPQTEVAERKYIPLKPMSIDEAALQMEMVDHPFFVFHNEASGQIEVLYRRRDGRYGLLQPKG